MGRKAVKFIMKVLLAAAEASPFVKVGGLADVVGGLSKKLVQLGIDARVVLPLYSIVQDLKEKAEFVTSIEVQNSWRSNYCGIFRTTVGGVTYYFIDNEYYFSRGKVYGAYDDGEIFAFFSRAVLDMLPAVNFMPDIINANDWHTAILPVYLNEFYKQKDEYKNIKTVLSIHNIEFQGKFDPYILGQLFGLDEHLKPLLSYDGNLNVLKAGIEACDKIVTVSKTYAKEILAEEHSHGLHHILSARQHKLVGIVNGIDTEVFDPAEDKFIKTNYSTKTLQNKRFNKIALQREMALSEGTGVPLFGMVTRLTKQKGLDLFFDVLDEISSLPIQLIVLGTGDEKYENLFRSWENSHHDKVRGVIMFSNEMASKIYAGADFLLMPSLSEPCGLSQLIAMRYGTIPVVHTVGGLADTVFPYNSETKSGCGITFQSFNSYDMLDAITRAIDIFHNKADFIKLRKNASSACVSWDDAAKEYLEVFSELI